MLKTRKLYITLRALITSIRLKLCSWHCRVNLLLCSLRELFKYHLSSRTIFMLFHWSEFPLWIVLGKCWFLNELVHPEVFLLLDVSHMMSPVIFLDKYFLMRIWNNGDWSLLSDHRLIISLDIHHPYDLCSAFPGLVIVVDRNSWQSLILCFENHKYIGISFDRDCTFRALCDYSIPQR